MFSSKKGIGFREILSMIMLVVVIVVSLYLIRTYARTDALDECIGSCVEREKCRFPNTITTNRCFEGGERVPDTVCCVSIDDLDTEKSKDEEDEQSSTNPTLPPVETNTCNKNDFPIYFSQDRYYRYQCLENDVARGCDLIKDEILSNPFDACESKDKKHPVYLNCCESETNGITEDVDESDETDGSSDETTEEQIVEPEIIFTLGKLGHEPPHTIYVDYEYYFRVNSKGSQVAKCEVYTMNIFGNLLTGNLAFNKTIEGNCEDLVVSLIPKEEDYNNIFNPHTGLPEFILRMFLWDDQGKLLYYKAHDFSINNVY